MPDEYTPDQVKATLEEAVAHVPRGWASQAEADQVVARSNRERRRRYRTIGVVVTAAAVVLVLALVLPLRWSNRNGTTTDVPPSPPPPATGPSLPGTAAPVTTSNLPVTTAAPPGPSSPTSTPTAPSTAAPAGPSTSSTSRPPTATATTAAAPADPAGFRASGGMGPGYYFVSPSANIACSIFDGGAGCQSRVRVANMPECANPDVSAPSASIRGGTASRTCVNQGFYTTEAPKVLPYGQSISAGGHTCSMAESGVSCRSTNGRGFTFATQGVTTF